QPALEQMEVQAERGVEREGVMDHRVEGRDPRDLRWPGGPEPFDPDEADAVDVDHVDAEVLDQVDLPTGKHRQTVSGVMVELLRPHIHGPVLAGPATPRVLRGEDDDLVAVRLELAPGRQDGRHDAVDRRQIAIREECDPHGISASALGSRASCPPGRSWDSIWALSPRSSDPSDPRGRTGRTQGIRRARRRGWPDHADAPILMSLLEVLGRARVDG